MNPREKSVLSTLLACAFMLALGGANAAPASVQSVETLLELTKAESLIDSTYTNMEPMMRQMIRQGAEGRTLTPRQQQAMDAMPAKLVALMRSQFNWANLKPQYIQLYVDVFDQDEIDGLIAFYRSPAGQAFIDKMPQVMQKSITLVQSQMQVLMPKMRQAIDEMVRDVQAGP